MGVFMEIIEWVDLDSNDMIHRIPEKGSADIKLGAQCIVRESQSAVFFNNGKATDMLSPGRHTLSTLNLPILTKILSLPWGFKSPFRAEVYFVNHKVFTNLKWGTRDPVAFRDAELGLIRLRGHGAYTCQINEPLVFLNKMVGRQALYSTYDIEDYLRDVIIARLNDYFGENLKTLFDLPAQYTEMATDLKKILMDEFTKYGMELVDFYISAITPPDEVQRMIDEKSGMKAVGDLDHFLKYEMAKAFGSSGAGSYAGPGAGLGMGAGVGLMAPMMMSKAFAPDQTDFKQHEIPTVTCPQCNADTPEESRFCYKCGHQMVRTNECHKCGAELPADAEFCMKCGTKLQTGERLECPECGQKLPDGTKFCFNCGKKLDDDEK